MTTTTKPMQQPDDVASETTIIPLVEEELRVAKRVVPRAIVRVEKITDTVEHVIQETVHEDEVEVVHVERDEIVSEMPQPRVENGVTIVPVVEEVLVVQKQLRLKEELHIRKRITERQVEIPVSVRSEHAKVTRLPTDKPIQE